MSGGRAWSVLAFLAVLLVAARWHTRNEPLERDLDIYALAGHQVLEGRTLYADVVDIKPPAIYLTWAAAELAVGLGSGQALLLGIGCALVTLAGIFVLFARCLGRPAEGLLAAAVWTLCASDLWLQANQPNTEAFLNAGLVSGLAGIATLRGERSRSGTVLIVGAILGWTTLYKHVIAVPIVLLLIVHVIVPPERTGRSKAAAQAGGILAIVAAAWGAVFASFAAGGAFHDLWSVLFVYPREYAARHGGSLAGNLIDGVRPDRLAPGGVFTLLLLAIVVAVPFGLRLGPRRPWALLAAWIVGTQLAISMPGQFFPHYDQLWLPVLSVGAGLTAMLLRDRLRARGRVAARVFASVVCLALLIRAAPQFRLDAEEWSRLKYGDRFVEARRLGERLGTALEPGETVFVWGVLPGVYLGSHRPQPTGIANVWLTLPAYGGSLSRDLTARLLRDLETAAPDVLVVDPATMRETPQDHPVLRWLDARYLPLPVAGRFPLAVRSDSPALERVLKLGSD